MNERQEELLTALLSYAHAYPRDAFPGVAGCVEAEEIEELERLLLGAREVAP